MLIIKIHLGSGSSSLLYNNIPETVSKIKENVLQTEIVNNSYLIHNGKLLQDDDVLSEGVVYVVPRLVGGKGGFGSMLRAIGAQIEKTTNREACRDLSGRRLRDINEEKRLKNWIAQQAEREVEVAERRRKKLERLCVEPKHNFNDKDYEKERSELTDNVCDAVEQGFRAAVSQGSGVKRKQSSTATSDAKIMKKKKKTCLWMDADEEELSSSLDSNDSDDGSDSRTSQGTEDKLFDGAGCSKSVRSAVYSDTDQDKVDKIGASQGALSVQNLETGQQTSDRVRCGEGKAGMSSKLDRLKEQTDTVTICKLEDSVEEEQCLAVA